MTTPATTGRKFFSYQDLVARGIRFSRVHLRRLEKAGAFPMHLQLGAGDATQAMKAWLADEIVAWEAERISARDAKIKQQAGTERARSREITVASIRRYVAERLHEGSE
jgi:predicted DNA-binding transcriptional regulator AlpA